MDKRDMTRQNPEIVNEFISQELFSIFEPLQQIGMPTVDTFSYDTIKLLCTKLEAAKKLSEQINDPIQNEILDTLFFSFDLLTTAGVIDQPHIFSEKAAHAYDLLKMALLSRKGQHAEKVLKDIREEREQYD